MTRLLIALALLLLAAPARATVLWSSNAEAGTCGNSVAQSVWDATECGDYPNNLMTYRCDTPVSGTGHSNYYRVDFQTGDHDAWNIQDADQGVSTINLTVGQTYYSGLFFRIDRIGGTDVWHDTGATPDSYDKFWETRGNVRILGAIGYPDWVETGVNGHFTAGIYFGEPYCSGCIYEQVEPNVSPYDRNNPLMLHYETWYALVVAVTPSNGSTQNGRIQMWINGVKTHDYSNIKTQDSSSPYVNMFDHSPTVAQPAYDAPAHYRKFDSFTFADSLSDMTTAGLMEDPEATADTLPPLAPKLLRVLK